MEIVSFAIKDKDTAEGEAVKDGCICLFLK